MSNPISWTGWTKDDWKELILDIVIFFLLIAAIVVMVIIKTIIPDSWSIGSFIDYLLILGFGLGIFFVIKDVKEILDERNYTKRPSKSSKSLYIEKRPRVDRRNQVFYRRSKRI